MVAHNRVELLAHPLSQKYLQMKWHSYGKYFHLANLLFYTIFLFSVTLFSAKLMEHSDTLDNINSNNSLVNDSQIEDILPNVPPTTTPPLPAVFHGRHRNIRNTVVYPNNQVNYPLKHLINISFSRYTSVLTRRKQEFQIPLRVITPK